MHKSDTSLQHRSPANCDGGEYEPKRSPNRLSNSTSARDQLCYLCVDSDNSGRISTFFIHRILELATFIASFFQEYFHDCIIDFWLSSKKDPRNKVLIGCEMLRPKF